MGRPAATDAEVEEVSKKSGCYDFIMDLENDFDTVAGGSGTHLSGGERQRISIARTTMKNAPILILDEATDDVTISAPNVCVNCIPKPLLDLPDLVIMTIAPFIPLEP